MRQQSTRHPDIPRPESTPEDVNERQINSLNKYSQTKTACNSLKQSEKRELNIYLKDFIN